MTCNLFIEIIFLPSSSIIQPYFLCTSDIDPLPLQNPLNNELIVKCLSANKLSLDAKEMHQMILTKIDSYGKTDNIEYQWAAKYSCK